MKGKESFKRLRIMLIYWIKERSHEDQEGMVEVC